MEGQQCDMIIKRFLSYLHCTCTLVKQYDLKVFISSYIWILQGMIKTAIDTLLWFGKIENLQ